MKILITIITVLMVSAAMGQDLTVANASSVAVREADSMRVQLQLDSLQYQTVRNIQVQYYDSVVRLPKQLTADQRKQRMDQLSTQRATSLQVVLTATQWTTYQQSMEEKRVLFEQRMRARRAQHQNN